MSHLTLSERIKIESWLNSRKNIYWIADALGISYIDPLNVIQSPKLLK